MQKLTIIFDDNIRGEKLQYDINRETVETSALSAGKIGKYEYLTGEEILSYDQNRIIEQTRFTCSSLSKAFEKQTRTIEEQVGALEVLKPITQKLTVNDAIPENTLCKEAKNQFNKSKETEKTIDRENLLVIDLLVKILNFRTSKTQKFRETSTKSRCS